MSDGRKNLFLTTVTVPPAPALSGLAMTVADPALPATPCNLTVCPPNVTPSLANAEIVRVTLNAAGTLTILRAQEGTNAQPIDVDWLVFQAPTVKMFTDVEAYADAAVLVETNARAAAITQEVTDRNAAIAVTAATLQPLDADLTAIAVQGTTAFGRGLIALAGSSALGALTTLDQHGAAAANVSMGGFQLTNLGAPGAPNSAATKQYVDDAVTGLLDFKGTIDASANPNYPAAQKGDAWLISVIGKIGGVSGISVDVGDMAVAIADNAGGTQAAVGNAWTILEHNVNGALLAANNLSDLQSAATARTNLGLGTAATQNSTAFDAAGAATAAQTAAQTYADTNKLAKSANLSDVASAPTTRANIGLGTTAANGDVTHYALRATQTYTQSTPPTGIQGSPILVTITATATDNAGGYGPQGNPPGAFGPRGLVNVEGNWQLGADQNTFAFTPITMADMMIVQNVVGANRAMVPGWGYIAARITLADTNTITLRGNDIGNGAAAFVDSSAFITAHSGSMAGTTNSYEMISFMSLPVVNGNTHLTKRTGFKVMDLNYYLGTPGVDFSTILSGISGIDAGVGVVDTQIGVDIPRLTKAARNIGISNGSATVWPTRLAPLTSSADAIPIDATVIAVSGSGTWNIAATPTIPDGIDGQIIDLVNVGTTVIGLQDQNQNSIATNLILGTAPGRKVINIGPNQSLRFLFRSGDWYLISPYDAGLELKDGITAHGAVTMYGSNLIGASFGVIQFYKRADDANACVQLQQFSGNGQLAMGPGGATAPDVTLARSAAAEWTLTGDLKMAGRTGATSATRLVGGVSAAAPTSGTFVAGDVVLDVKGGLWTNTVGGTPGTWNRTAPNQAVYSNPTLQTAVASIATSASLFSSSTAPAALFPANTLVIADTINIAASGELFNNSAGSATMSVAVKIGGQIVASTASVAVAASATSTRKWYINVTLSVALLGAFLTSSMLGSQLSNISGANNSQLVVANSIAANLAASWNTTADAALDVVVSSNVNDVNTSGTLKSIVITKVSK